MSVSFTEADADLFAQHAHKLVDDVIEAAMKKLADENLQREETLNSINEYNTSRTTTPVYKEPVYEECEVANIEWLIIRDFTVQDAAQKIEEFVQTWEFQNSWLHCIDYLGKNELEFDTRHRYRVRWSIPTRRKPIPRATACVYFTFEVSKIKPKTYPVSVYYVFETHNLVHRPGFSRFREKWLKDIIESKVITMAAVNF